MIGRLPGSLCVVDLVSKVPPIQPSCKLTVLCVRFGLDSRPTAPPKHRHPLTQVASYVSGVVTILKTLWGDGSSPDALLLERLLQAALLARYTQCFEDMSGWEVWIYNSFDLSEDGKEALGEEMGMLGCQVGVA